MLFCNELAAVTVCCRFATDTTIKTDFEGKSVIKEEQRKFLIEYCNQHSLWAVDLHGEERFLPRGGEALVLSAAYFLWEALSE